MRSRPSFAVEILELVEHFIIPEAFGLEVIDELAIEDDEVPAEVTLYVEVRVVRLDAWGGSHDVRDGGGRCDGEDVTIPHAVLGDALADGAPVHFTAAWDVDFDPALVLEGVDGVLRHDAAIPFRPFVRTVGSALAG